VAGPALDGDGDAWAALAESLEQFAGRLGADGRFLPAAQAAEEAEAVARELADGTGCHAHTLHWFSVALTATGRYSAALAQRGRLARCC